MLIEEDALLLGQQPHQHKEPVPKCIVFPSSLLQDLFLTHQDSSLIIYNYNHRGKREAFYFIVKFSGQKTVSKNMSTSST